MCAPAVGMGLQIIGAVSQQKSLEANVKAQQEAAVAQAQNATKSMNYAFQNYEMERADAFDQAVQKIEKTRLNAMVLNASTEAAINEDYAGGGRTAGLLNRSVKGDELRAVGSIKENYQRKSNEIDINKENALLSTKNYISDIKVPSMPSRLNALVNIGSSVVGYNTALENAKVNKAIKLGTRK